MGVRVSGREHDEFTFGDDEDRLSEYDLRQVDPDMSTRPSGPFPNVEDPERAPTDMERT